MKTVLPNAINSVEEAKQLLTDLANNNEVYHPEDDAFDIYWHTSQPTDDEKRQLNKLMGMIYELDNFDPCDFLIDELKFGH